MTLFTATEPPSQARGDALSLRERLASLSAVRRHAVSVLIGVAVVVGLGLRIAAARSELWVDELWSLDLVSHLTSPDQVFWAISHDNNHFLNSLWMYLVGQQAAPLVYRLPSIVFSTAAILVAARIGARVNAAASVMAAFMASCSYALVAHGSEARGYGGLILALLLAVDIGQSLVNRAVGGEDAPTDAPKPGWRSGRWGLALVVAFGTCSHLTMMAEPVLLGAAALIRFKRSGRPALKALDATVDLFRPTAILLIPIIAALAAGVMVEGQFTLGDRIPFSPGRLLHAYGRLLEVLLGVPSSLPPWVGLAAAALIVGAGFATRLIDRRWLPLVAVAMVLWPALLYLGHVQNSGLGRYYLASGLLLPMLFAEAAGRLWAGGGPARWLAGAAVVAVCAGQVPYLHRLLLDNTLAHATAIVWMGLDKPTTFPVV